MLAAATTAPLFELLDGAGELPVLDEEADAEALVAEVDKVALLNVALRVRLPPVAALPLAPTPVPTTPVPRGAVVVVAVELDDGVVLLALETPKPEDGEEPVAATVAEERGFVTTELMADEMAEEEEPPVRVMAPV